LKQILQEKDRLVEDYKERVHSLEKRIEDMTREY
jgi:hypothetical protein